MPRTRARDLVLPCEPNCIKLDSYRKMRRKLGNAIVESDLGSLREIAQIDTTINSTLRTLHATG